MRAEVRINSTHLPTPFVGNALLVQQLKRLQILNITDLQLFLDRTGPHIHRLYKCTNIPHDFVKLL